MFPSTFTLPAAADFHVHLRDGLLSAAVVPTIRAGGVSTVYVMPNLVPPLTTVAAVKAYHGRLAALDASVRYLMTLYLHPDVTPQTIREARASGVVWGVKSYPAGVTTNSDAGVLSYEDFYPVFDEMERAGLVLNLHGECPNDEEAGVDVMNAERRFLPTLRDLHRRFPNLKVGFGISASFA
jgi:dihydroorotase